MDDPKEELLYSPDKLQKEDYSNPYKYYNDLSAAYTNAQGNRTIGGYDQTGKVDYVEWYTDGSVRMIYHGSFKYGKPDDQEGSSWEIVCDESRNVNYQYNIGLFTAGRYDGDSSSAAGYNENMEDLTLSQISEIIKGTAFETMDLNWNMGMVKWK